MTLWDLTKQQSAIVTSVDSLLNEKVLSRLHEMGVEAGRELSCVRRGPMGGPIVMQIGGSIFAFEQGLASQINVKPIN